MQLAVIARLDIVSPNKADVFGIEKILPRFMGYIYPRPAVVLCNQKARNIVSKQRGYGVCDIFFSDRERLHGNRLLRRFRVNFRRDLSGRRQPVNSEERSSPQQRRQAKYFVNKFSHVIPQPGRFVSISSALVSV